MSKQRVIFKYPLDLTAEVQTRRIPGQNPVVKHVGVQHGIICLWVEVDPSAGLLVSDFKIVGTGDSYNSGVWKHIGTVPWVDGTLIWHVLQAVKL